ncbi:gp63, partial [Symbiodinium pilosum]
MAAESSAVPRISEMTLALMEDSGWYRVLGGLGTDSDSAAGHFIFGRGKGCGFLQQSCIIDKQSAFPDTFCTESQGSCVNPNAGTVTCSHDHLSLGACTNCLHQAALPTRYQHFDDPRLGGIAQYIGYCPTVEPFWSSGQPTSCTTGGGVYSAGVSQRFGESHGPASRCVLSTAIVSGYVPPAQPMGTCRDISCLEDGLRIRIGADNFVICGKNEAGVQKHAHGQFE